MFWGELPFFKIALRRLPASPDLRMVSVLCWGVMAAPEETPCCAGARVVPRVTRLERMNSGWGNKNTRLPVTSCLHLVCFVAEYWDNKLQQQLGGRLGVLRRLSHVSTNSHPVRQPQPSRQGTTDDSHNTRLNNDATQCTMDYNIFIHFIIFDTSTNIDKSWNKFSNPVQFKILVVNINILALRLNFTWWISENTVDEYKLSTVRLNLMMEKLLLTCLFLQKENLDLAFKTGASVGISASLVRCFTQL